MWRTSRMILIESGTGNAKETRARSRARRRESNVREDQADIVEREILVA